jgi:arsenate reductase
MTDKTCHVLFICTHNSARSIMAEALLNRYGAPRFKAWSAGSHPAGAVQPQALQTLADLHVPVQDPRSKDWSEFAQPDAPTMDFVFTVCDNAAGEVCPVWPGQPMTAHWGVADPKLPRDYRDAALTLKRRIELMLALPMASLERLALQHQLDTIGRS